jgi:hypothetical protein
VTFVLFGDVEMQSAVDPANPNQAPMQAFYLTTGVGNAPCNEAPQNGLLVQTPKGIGEVAFNVNGVDVQMGSTVLFQAHPGAEFEVKTLQGSAALTINGKTYPILAGSEFKGLLNDDLTLDPDQFLIQAYDLLDVEGLPLGSLEELIGIAEPLTSDEIDDILNKWANGEALCSDDASSYLPGCDEVLSTFGGDPCADAGDLADMCRGVLENGNPCDFVEPDQVDICNAAMSGDLDAIGALQDIGGLGDLEDLGNLGGQGLLGSLNPDDPDGSGDDEGDNGEGSEGTGEEGGGEESGGGDDGGGSEGSEGTGEEGGGEESGGGGGEEGGGEESGGGGGEEGGGGEGGEG